MIGLICRWEEEGIPKHPMAWFPFGAGPRLCLGMRLAYMEEKLALAHLLKNFDILSTDKTPLSVVRDPGNDGFFRSGRAPTVRLHHRLAEGRACRAEEAFEVINRSP